MPTQNLTDESNAVKDFYMHMQDFDQNQDDDFQESLQKAMDWMRLSLSRVNKQSGGNGERASSIVCDASNTDSSNPLRGRNEVSPEERNKQKKLKQIENKTNTVTKYMSKDANKNVYPTNPRRVSDQHETTMDSDAASTGTNHIGLQPVEAKNCLASVHDSQDNFDINPYDDWNTVYKKMKKGGWTHRNGDLFHSYFYVKPGCSVKNGTMNVDYFTSEEQLQEYARKHYGWRDGVAENLKLLGQTKDQNENEYDEGDDDCFGSQPNTEDEDLVDDSLEDLEEGCYSRNKQNVVSNVFEYEDEPSQVKASIVVTKKRSNGFSKASNKKRKIEKMHNDEMASNQRKTSSKSTARTGPRTPPFKEVWPQLANMGWKCVYSKLGGEDYFRPGFNPKDSNLVQGEHYFHERDELLQYIKKNDVGLEDANDESGSDDESEIQSDEETNMVSLGSKASKKMRTSKAVNQKKTSSKSTARTGPRTPPFKEVWPQLANMGWKCVYSKLGGEDYFRPGFNPKDSNLVQGEHYFHERDELLQYIKKNDVGLENASDESGSDDESEAQSERGNEVAPVSSPTLSESSADNSYLEPFTIEGCDNCWWNTESIPKFLLVWNVIREKLGVSYTGGNYKTSDGETFTSPEEMLQHLNRFGVSAKAMKGLTEEERTSVTRMISMSNLPKKIGSHSLNPDTSQVLLSNLFGGGSFDDDRAWAALVSYFGGQNPDGEYSLGLEHDSFPHCMNLSEVREAIRKGLLNHIGGKDEDKDEAYAALILWASVLPIPLIQDDQNEDRDDIEDEGGNECNSEWRHNDDMTPLTQAEASSIGNVILNQEDDEEVTMSSSSSQPIPPPPSAKFARIETVEKTGLSTPRDSKLTENAYDDSPSALSQSEREEFVTLMTMEELNNALNPPHEEVIYQTKVLFKSTDKV